MGKGELRRISEVFDCWFESGSMPYAQSHYPFEVGVVEGYLYFTYLIFASCWGLVIDS